MRKYWLLFFAVVLPAIVFGQQYRSIKGYVRFYSEAPVENIEAVSIEGTSIVDFSEEAIAFSIPIRSFHFKKSLMQEHFNENYMESEKYPTATFSGKFIGLDKNKKAVQKIKAVGKMKIHGVERDISVEGEITPGDNYLKVKSKFNIALADYDIKIPSIVTYNISEVVEVTVLFDYAKL